MKRYYVQYNVGKVKYLLSYHNGEKKHKDGSDFFDVRTFKNKRALNAAIQVLQQEGYKGIELS